MMLSARPHLSVEQWLEKLELPLYIPVFKAYNGVEDMLHLSERELKSMGIRSGSHRARIATSLAILREKYQRAHKSHSPNTSTLLVKVDNSSSRSHESISPVHRLSLEAAPSGVRSWPSSGSSSLNHSRHSSHRSSMEESLGINATLEELKKALEWELSLDRSDLRSHAWYHGTILRQRAEELIMNEGDFIVRDCISQPGDFVITCKWNRLPLHFIIKKVILQPNTIYEKVQFCFEDDSFDSIHDFITYYVGSQCPLSSTSGAVISNPINRSMPLSYYASRYGVQCQVHYAAKALEKIPPVPKHSSQDDINASHKPQRNFVNSNPTLEENDVPSKCVAAGDVIPVRRCKLVRVGSDPSINPNAEKKQLENRPNSGTFTTEASKEIASKIENDNPPPKPSRVPSKKWVTKPLVIKKERKMTPPTPLLELICNNEAFLHDNEHASLANTPEKDTVLRQGRPILYKRMISGETRFSFLDHPSVSSDGSFSDTETLCSPFTIPKLHQDTCFNPSTFHSSLLMSQDNKPLEIAVVNKVQQVLLSENSKTLANHLTRIDLEMSKNCNEEDLGLGVTSGLEMILLPQGRQLVEDLLERTHCLKTFVVITILTCTSEEERVQILKKWIEVAIDTKGLCGNIYGFTGIMLGLTVPQVSNLHFTWLELRRLHTEATFTFETKLRPAFKAMQAASFQVTPNTCIPYILSILFILHHHLSVMQAMEHKSQNKQVEEKDFNFGFPSENNSTDFGLQVLEDHLETSRNILLQWPVFHSNADITLRKVKYDEILLDFFRTEFHMRMLWGSRGAIVSSEERHKKFEKVLDVLFKRYQQQFQQES